jgi:hypothetical protein
MRNNAQEVIVTCMGRERDQYSGNASFCRHAIHSLAGENRQVARFLRSHSQGSTAEGYFMDVWPSHDRLARLGQRVLEATHRGAILDHGLRFTFDCWEYYLYTGDLAPLREPYPRLLRQVNYLRGKMNQDGLLPVDQDDCRFPIVYVGFSGTRKGLKAELGPGELSRGRPDLKFPAIPDLIRNQGGFTIDLWLEWADLSPGQILLDNRDARGSGILLRTNLDGALELTLGDSKVTNMWTVDRNTLQPGRRHHIVAIADGGPKVILFVVDGVLCDGGAEREFGWGRSSPFLQSPNSDQPLRLAPNFRGRLAGARLYNRAVTVSEAIGNSRAGPPPLSP